MMASQNILGGGYSFRGGLKRDKGPALSDAFRKMPGLRMRDSGLNQGAGQTARCSPDARAYECDRQPAAYKNQPDPRNGQLCQTKKETRKATDNGTLFRILDGEMRRLMRFTDGGMRRHYTDVFTRPAALDQFLNGAFRIRRIVE